MSAADEAYSYTKDRILDGRFPGNEMISEGEVAGPTGLSRTPVREAFLRLEVEGLLRLFPKRGALVVAVSPGEVESVMETRLLVELNGLEKAIERRAEVARQLDTAIERQQQLVADGDSAGFVEADREFHRILVGAAANPILLDLHDSMRDRQTRMGMTAIARTDGRTESILKEHRKIAVAVRRGDGERAATLLRKHLDATFELLRLTS